MCRECAKKIREKIEKQSRRDEALTPNRFRSLWNEQWGATRYMLDTDNERLAALCDTYEPGQIRSAVHSAWSIDGIERWCQALADGRNPDSSGFDGNYRDYGMFKCPTCGKAGGCSHRRGGSL